MPDFSLGCFQNEYLARGAGEVNAVIAVTSSGASDESSRRPGDPGATARVEIIAVDTSGSMAGRKILAARQATAAAVAAIRDGVRFAVVAGDHSARVIYPQDG